MPCPISTCVVSDEDLRGKAMPSRYRHSSRLRPRLSLAFVLLAVLFGTLWVAGGASRGDAFGQVIVRAVAWIALVCFILFSERVAPVSRPVAWIVGAALVLDLLQLVPLPPAVWQDLPGRAPFWEAAAAIGQPQPWRPWSIVPGATANAAASLVVPFAVLLLITGLSENERRWLPGLVLALIALSSFVGLIQFSGIVISNPLINDSLGEVAGTFANRNHFAVFMGLGCLIAPTWAFPAGSAAGWRAPIAIGLSLLFALTILASGSRAGILVGVLGLTIGLVLARSGIRRSLRRYPRWVSWAMLAGVVATISAAVLLSVAAGRAISIDRAMGVDGSQDMRLRSMPVVWEMIREYFPFGSGVGAFDPVFRMNEPFTLLKPTYFNHVHNDWAEVVLDAGLFGIVLLLTAVGWWAWASAQAWWIARQRHGLAPRLGSAIILLVMAASAFDYPARTPMMMAVLTLAAIWLADVNEASALPTAK